MTIHIVCRYNQARSIIGAAAIRKFFPEIVVVSSGVEADPKTPIPKSIAKIAREWDLNIVEERSTPFLNVLDSITESDLVLAADSFVAERIHAASPQLRVREFREFVEHPEFIAVDPATMGHDGIRQELAKSVVSALAAARELIGESANIQTLIPRDESALESMRPKILEMCQQKNLVVIDTSLRVSTLDAWRKISTNFQMYNERSSLPTINEGVSGVLLVPEHEWLTPERTLASVEWRDWLRSLAQSRLVLLLAPAQLAGQTSLNVDALWSSVHSGRTFLDSGEIIS